MLTTTKKIFVTTFRPWELQEVTDPRYKKKAAFELPPGRYELLRLTNPLGYPGYWLVLATARAEDRVVGMAEGAWRQWTNGLLTDDPTHPNFGKPIDWKDWEIRFEET